MLQQQSLVQEQCRPAEPVLTVAALERIFMSKDDIDVFELPNSFSIGGHFVDDEVVVHEEKKVS